MSSRASTIASWSDDEQDLGSQQFQSFDDGDTFLLSRDGTSFQVDSIVLRRASPVFASLLRLYPDIYHYHEGTLHSPDDKRRSRPIPMLEDAAILSRVLASIYPSCPQYTQSHAERAISSIDIAVNVIHATSRLEISDGLLSRAASSYVGQLTPPIRAWAIAVNVNAESARTIAIRRCITQGVDPQAAESIAELDGVGPLRLLHFLNVVNQARMYSNALFNAFVQLVFCYHHRDVDLLRKAQAAPFALDSWLADEILLNDVLSGFCHRNEDWCKCGEAFEKFDLKPSDLGREIKALLDEAVEAEREGVSVTKPEVIHTWRLLDRE